MREILFRGKRESDGKWVYGNYIKSPTCQNLYMIEDTEPTIMYSGDRHFLGCPPVDPSTVGQYTGLKDKNGKRIFEGDIISIHIESDDEVYDEVSYIDWLNCGWYYCQKGTLDSELEAYQSDSRMLTVIGNIHDNPELLKGDSDNA